MEELTSPTAKIGEESPCSPAMDAMTSPSTSFLPPCDINNGIEAETPSSTLAEAATPAMEDAGTPPTEAASPAEHDEHPHAACNGQSSAAMVEDNCEDQGPLGLLVHIDMKGGPPRPQYLVQLLPLLKQWGATGLLIEWEDMFPWEGELSLLARNDHWTRNEVGQLLSTAANLELQVVPLVQTFGHMEFVLKHGKFRHLREVLEYPNSLRPIAADNGELGGGVAELVKEMIRQVVELHEENLDLGALQCIHIGCDEVWCLGQGVETRALLDSRCWSVTDVALDHMASVARIARDCRPGINVLAWDDMMREASVEQVRFKMLDTLLHPVVWSYGEQLALDPSLLDRYAQLWGKGSVWGGSAWRGATGSNMAATTVRHHLNNQLAWLGLIQRGASLAGIVLTGWARYDHYATLCELLPCGLPSLRCCLAALLSHGWTFDTHKQCSSSLGLSSPILLEPYCFLTGPVPESPTYPGSKVYSLVLAYTRLQAQHTALTTSSARQTWINPWQIEKGFLNPLQVKVTLRELIKLGEQLRELAVLLGRELAETMYEFTAEEWINTNISPKIREIDELVASVDVGLAKHEQKFVLIPLSREVGKAPSTEHP